MQVDLIPKPIHLDLGCLNLQLRISIIKIKYSYEILKKKPKLFES